LSTPKLAASPAGGFVVLLQLSLDRCDPRRRYRTARASRLREALGVSSAISSGRGRRSQAPVLRNRRASALPFGLAFTVTPSFWLHQFVIYAAATSRELQKLVSRGCRNRAENRL